MHRRFPQRFSFVMFALVLAMVQLAFLPAAAQSDLNFTALTTKDGLSSNVINCILKDKYGLMWFATEDGLDKFDGTAFTVYKYRANDSSSIQSNEILSLYEDKKGRLWIGTSGGSLSLYDRDHDKFINYPSNHKPNGIGNNVIRSICSDNEGRIWIAHFDGINILDPATGTITVFTAPPSRSFSQICTALFEDSKKRMWIGTSMGLYIYDPAAHTTIGLQKDLSNPASLPNNEINVITEDVEGNVWIGSQGGMSMYRDDGKNFINYIHDERNPKTIANNVVHSIASDKDGSLWIGTETGLNILHQPDGQWQSFSFDDRNMYGLNSRAVRWIYIDEQGIYWLGTSRGGVNKYDKNLNLFNRIGCNPFDAEGLNMPIVTTFQQMPDGKIAVGTEGGGLSLFNPSTKKFYHYNIESKKENWNHKIVALCLAITSSKKLLLGTFADGLFVINPADGSYRQILKGTGTGQLNSNDLYCIREDSKGNIWIGTNGDGINVLNPAFTVIKRYTPNPSQPIDIKLPINGYLRDMIEDKEGNMWIATHGGGMACLHTSTAVFTIYNTNNSQLPNDKVQCLLKDAQDNIWCGTKGSGLAMFDIAKHQFELIGEKDGLENNTIHKIIQDKQGILWISTNQGISSINPANKKINNYDYHNGIQHNNFVRGAGTLASNGYIYFGSMEGFNYFNPGDLKKNQHIPPVLITDLKISNQSVNPSEKGAIQENISVAKQINLEYKQNFALRFVGLNYTAPEQNQYAYKLDGFDKDWNYIGSLTTASYTNLDPGNYVFRVKASNNDGVWNNQDTSIKIYVRPPWWKTVYAYVLYVLSFISLLFFIRYKGIQKIEKKFKLEQERNEAKKVHELDQLKIKFLTNLSHEFRTPISLILGPVDALISKENNHWSLNQLNIIRRNGKRLLNLVSQLLDFRKMEEHELVLQTSEGDLIAFVKDIFDSFKDLSERKHIVFSFSASVQQYHTCFDHDKIERILFNLLSNAFKFTLGGGIVYLFIEHPQTDANDISWITIRVKDSGIGIPAEKKEKIFERFYQNTTAAAVLNQGSGIGLSITKEFVALHGGTVAVESELGQGTCFSITLPLREMKQTSLTAATDSPTPFHSLTATAIESAEMEPINHKGSSSLSILLVEDSDDFRLYLKENLTCHYKIYEASDGKDGWQKALALHPHLIVSDISMPYMDGIELCKKIKSDKRTNHIPVILLTALAGEAEQLKGLKIGANDYVTKPFNVDMLHAKIKNLLVLKETFKNTYTRQFEVSPKTLPITVSDDEKLMATIMRYLEDNMTEQQVSVETLSRHVGMSRSSLYNKLLELTGQSPVEFIRSIKLDKAAQLLEKSDMNVAQIAYTVGFATPKYFARSFKAKYNMLPSEYQSQLRKNKNNSP